MSQILTKISQIIGKYIRQSLKWHLYLIIILHFGYLPDQTVKKPIRHFHIVTKVPISIRVFHLLCQFVFFTTVSIRVFAPFPKPSLHLTVFTVIVKYYMDVVVNLYFS